MSRYNNLIIRRAGELATVVALFAVPVCLMADTATEATRGLVQRLIPKKADSFIFETIAPEKDCDVFEIESRADKIVLRGNNGVAMAMGLNWYLKHYCHCDVSWYGNQLNMPKSLPRVEPKVRHVSWARYRYFLNYCCFGYSLPWWNWEQWEKLVDWMALNGVNMPLAVTGQESVWQAVCKQLGMSDSQITEFLAGPPYLPFQWMGCLDGYGGPLPKSWISKHEELEKKILARERELGMKPVLQGFTGHVPGAVAQLFPGAPLQKIKWIEWETYLLDPLDPLFAKIAKMFLEEQTRLYGTDHLYASDTFIEMTPPNGDLKYLADLGRAIYDGMAKTDPQVIWVLQGWAFMNQRQFWTQPRFKSFLDAIPDDRLVVLDLFCESNPMWDKTDAFCGKPWLWCNVQNFGRRVHLAGWLDRNNDALFGAKKDPKSGKLIGLGFVNEGLCYNPVAYDLMFENAWRNEAVDLPTWIDEYAHHRYGSPNASASRAWRVLLDTVFMKGDRGNSASAIDQVPKLQVGPARPSSNDKLAEAWFALDEASSAFRDVDTFRFDLVNVARQVLVNHARVLQGDIAKARDAKNIPQFEQASKRFLQLIADIDELLATRKEFLLGDCLADARRWGDTREERAKCEWNARRVLTLWGATTAINDYASKQWSGMFNGYYALRWKKYLDAVAESLKSGKTFDEATLKKDLVSWTAQWADGRETYPSKPRGDSVAVAQKMWKKYGDALCIGAGKAGVAKSSPVSGDIKANNAYLPGTQAKSAEASIAADKLKLSNALLTAMWQVTGGKFQAVGFTDQVTGKTIPVGNDVFSIFLGDGRNIKSSEMTIVKKPKITSLKPESGAARLAEHFAGKQIALTLADIDDRLRVTWRGILRDDSNYVRQEVSLSTVKGEVTVREIVLYEANVPDARVCGTVEGSPVVAGNFFLGYEHPMSHNMASNSVRCSFVRNAPLKPGEDLMQSFVMGVAPAGQLRRGFLYYLERERAHPYRPYLHYNSWWDIAWGNRKFTESESIQAIDYIGRELVTARGVKVDGFLFDDGWDDNKTLWQFHSGFPNGFLPLKNEAERFGGGIAVWVSPFGGYGGAKAQRLKFGAEQGFETNSNGFSMSGPQYYERFKNICTEMIKTYGINHFKFDGLAAGSKATGGLMRDGDAMLSLIRELRAIKPDLYINQTVGTWPSPFWLRHVDSTWRGGDDDGFYGAGSLRQQWITYRDKITYENVVKRGPLYPLSSLMNCGIIFAKNDSRLKTADEKDFRDEVRSFFGCGTQLQELYITPELFTAKHWDLLAESAKWARARTSTLVDVHWVGGNPGLGEVYGWAAWAPKQGTLVLRNPSDKKGEISLDIGQAFELPEDAVKKYALKSPYKDQRITDLTVESGQARLFRLEPFEVLVFDATPVSTSLLRLVPFPKEISLEKGVFALDRPLVLSAPAGVMDTVRRLLAAELQRAKLPVPEFKTLGKNARRISMSTRADIPVPAFKFRDGTGPEDYAIEIHPDTITCGSTDVQGLLHAVQTLCQLVRANRDGNSIPCLSIRDWPSLKYRGYQNDMTRGPSATLETLKGQIDLSAYLKMNLFSYYMEYQFAFKKYPMIGPPDGSLTPEELKALVHYGRPVKVDILGNQQSFGHFGAILKHPQFADLKEGSDVLCPLKEGTYKLLDDMYSEVCPLLPFPMFNVCCDETWELGKGPSKEMADKIGVGGVYVRHIRRVHDLLKKNHDKRMMMWGDIILQHPDKLGEIPKDTVMLTWGYHAGTNFENQIIPFARSGYDFFICPGVSSWSRILPDFRCASTNIMNFVRDGVKHGAIGMLNTDWKDDCESLNAPTWHGAAWGAECAWNASTTTPEDFNRRIGAVLFGEKGDHFGQAIELLSQTFGMGGMKGMHNSRFMQNDFMPRQEPAAVRSSAEQLLKVVRPALEHLDVCRRDAKVNAELLDAVVLGARRMELIGQRMLDGVDAIELYNRACDESPAQAVIILEKIRGLIQKNRDAHEGLGRQFAALWNREVKPFALDRVMERYAVIAKQHDELLARISEAARKASAGQPLPFPNKVGLSADTLSRHIWPDENVYSPLAQEVPWADASASHRLGLVVKSGNVARSQLPVELDLPLPAELVSKHVRAFYTIQGTQNQEIPVQLDPSEKKNRARLTMLLPGPIPSKSQATVHVYLGLPAKQTALSQSVSTSDADGGMKWIENDKVRLLLGPEGAHIYRWEVKALQNRDLTHPGENGWSGFSDLGGKLRDTRNVLTCLASGPALVRYRCTAPSGMVKQISLFGGASWVEILLNDNTGYYWDFDDTRNFAADGPTPGKYLFSSGESGSVGRQADGASAQVKVAKAQWSIKYNDQKLALGMVTPGIATRHVIGPGSGAGGVGLEGSDVNHIVTFAGLLECEPGKAMNSIRQTLDLKNQPEVVVYGLEVRK